MIYNMTTSDTQNINKSELARTSKSSPALTSLVEVWKTLATSDTLTVIVIEGVAQPSEDHCGK